MPTTDIPTLIDTAGQTPEGLSAKDCSGLLGKLGWFRDAGKQICIAEVKEVDVECPWASNMLLVLYERWPECEKHDGYIDPGDFHPLDCQNTPSELPDGRSERG